MGGRTALGCTALGRPAALAALALAGAAALAGCASEPGGGATGAPGASGAAAPASPTPSASAGAVASEPPVPVEAPPIAEGEISRVLLDATPADGITTGGHTASGAVSADVPVVLEGACAGDSVGYEVVTADEERRVLLSGTLTCDAPGSLGGARSLAHTGPVQIMLTRADADTAWLRLVPA